METKEREHGHPQNSRWMCSQGQNDADRRCAVRAGSAGGQSDGCAADQVREQAGGRRQTALSFGTAHVLGVLSQALSAPTMRDQRRLKKIARFLAGTKEVELLLKPNAKNGKPVVQAMVDANWADDAIDRKSTSGGVLYFHGCAIATWSRRQSCVALSSAESELYALGSAVLEE